MSMNAVFIQVEDSELTRLIADPDSVEALFTDHSISTAGLLNAASVMQARLRAFGPQEFAQKLANLPEPLRQQLHAGVARANAAVAAGTDITKLLQDRLGQRAQRGGGGREVLSLDKAWNGVHYLLAGAATELATQAVLGGAELGGDPEGFSGYGPARYFDAAQVREINEALSRPEAESQAAERFDPELMSELEIYPGWSPEGDSKIGADDKEWVMDAFHRLRDFYASAAANGRAVVTCLV